MSKTTTVKCPDCKRTFRYNDNTDEYPEAPWETVVRVPRNVTTEDDVVIEIFEARCGCGQRIAMCCMDDAGMDLFKRL